MYICAIVIIVINSPYTQAHPTVLGLSIGAMGSHTDLWDCYFNDFITHKLKLEDNSIAQQILHKYFEKMDKQIHEASEKIAWVHCYVRIYQLRFAEMATTLRPLKVHNYMCS